MIFPILNGLSSFRRSPVTWILVLTNVFLFSQNWQQSKASRGQLQSWYQDGEFLTTQGRVYQQFKEARQPAFRSLKDRRFLGVMAFQDQDFLDQAQQTQWVGDQVAIRSWQESLEQYIFIRDFYPAYAHGVHAGDKQLFSFFSYQFFHEGFMHLFGNILLIMLVGNFLEKRHSGLLVFTTYLITGAGAAWLYTVLLGANGAPLIGASGSLCGLLGLFFTLHFQEKTNVLFFVLPKEGYYGLTRLQTGLWVPWLCVLEDIAGWMARPELYAGGISHFVHLMGFFCGCGLGLALMAAKRLGKSEGDGLLKTESF